LAKSPCFTDEERNGFSKLLLEGRLVDTFREQHPTMIKYTFWKKDGIHGDDRESNSGWRLDYFLVSESAKEKAISTEMLEDYVGSDHLPIKLVWSA